MRTPRQNCDDRQCGHRRQDDTPVINEVNPGAVVVHHGTGLCPNGSAYRTEVAEVLVVLGGGASPECLSGGGVDRNRLCPDTSQQCGQNSGGAAKPVVDHGASVRCCDRRLVAVVDKGILVPSRHDVPDHGYRTDFRHWNPPEILTKKACLNTPLAILVNVQATPIQQ